MVGSSLATFANKCETVCTMLGTPIIRSAAMRERIETLGRILHGSGSPVGDACNAVVARDYLTHVALLPFYEQ